MASLTWYRVRVHQADDCDMERLVADMYVEADTTAGALTALAARTDDYFGYAEMAAGVASLSTRIDPVESST